MTAALRKTIKKVVFKGPPAHRGPMVESLSPVVVIGASAGGLEAILTLLKRLPPDTAMTFILIQHLQPDHESLLPLVLRKSTAMQVLEIRQGMQLLPNHLFVGPPGMNVGVNHSHFTLRPNPKHSPQNLSIDYCFSQIATSFGNRSIGVILSGSATDGTEGLRAIKAAGGVTLVQDPKTARYRSMPLHALNAEVADFCLTLPRLALELIRLSKLSYLKNKAQTELILSQDLKTIHSIFQLIKSVTQIDFTEYKISTTTRRLDRRIALTKLSNRKQYLIYLQKHDEETVKLAEDILIHVTSFFRDPLVFNQLAKSVFPKLVRQRDPKKPIRIWVVGCSSGEEVYSIAMSLLDFLNKRKLQYSIEIFGSDLSEKMIESARRGIYLGSQLDKIPTKYRTDFFDKTEDGYRIKTKVRELCTFVKHNVTHDPPFSKMDLITCRNVLIYFEGMLQKKVLDTFHYCLNPSGFLLLGQTENTGAAPSLFNVFLDPARIFNKVPHPLTAFSQKSPLQPPITPPTLSQSRRLSLDSLESTLTRKTNEIILSDYAPTSVLINKRLDVIQYRGRTDHYLDTLPTEPRQNLFKTLRLGLYAATKSAIKEAKLKATSVTRKNVAFRNLKQRLLCNIRVTPILVTPDTDQVESSQHYYLIQFEDLPCAYGNKKFQAKKTELDLELKSLCDDHKIANDTLHTTNEELTSGNEELQSMNEELETAKEELQSTNEELITVNDELQNRSLEIRKINDDLVNILYCVQIPIVILDVHKRIKRFTPQATSLLNVVATDVGRSIDEIKFNIHVDSLDRDIQEVLSNHKPMEIEVQDRQKQWQRLQIKPYLSSSGQTDGVILSLTNVDFLKRAVIDAEWIRDYAESIVEAVPIPLIVLNDHLQINSANHAFYETYHFEKAQVVQKNFFGLHSKTTHFSELKAALLPQILARKSFQNIEITHSLANRTPQVLSASGRPIQAPPNTALFLISLEEITARKALLKQAQEARTIADQANVSKDLFLATLSHELRTPLTSLLLQAQMLQYGPYDENRIKKASQVIERAAQTQTQLIEDLLDVSRIVTGNLKMKCISVNLKEILLAAVETVSGTALSKHIKISVKNEGQAGQVSGDPIRLQQIFWNLLINALKFSPPDSVISIQLKPVILDQHKTGAQVRIKDQGIGIKKEFLPHVFKRFTQEESSSTRTHGGLGLGLAIVHHLVEIHHGTITVFSKGSNKGATFTVTLPTLDAKPIQTIPHKKSTASKRILSGMKVLVVEDDPDAREAITNTLSLAGVEVRQASCAIEAMESLTTFTPDEMIIDIAMPGEDGYCLLRKIRSMTVKEKRKIPAIALTALAGKKDISNALLAGFKAHLSKPINMTQLYEALLQSEIELP